jgi:hypothetical protein
MSGLAHIVSQTTNNSLGYYSAMPGDPLWVNVTLFPGLVASAPSLYVEADAQIHVAFQGPNNSLYYATAVCPNVVLRDCETAFTNGTVQAQLVVGANTTFSAPSIAVRGQVPHIVARGVNSYIEYAPDGNGGWTQTILNYR